MVISWLGEAGLRVQTKDATILVDPPAASTGFKPTRQQADVVLLTRSEQRDAKGVGGEPMVIDAPGEYERKNVFVYGLALASEPQRVHWRIEAEDVSLGHLADLQHSLENGELTQLEGVDVLFVPVGGGTVLTAERAAELISQIEPRVVIPIQYKIPGMKSGYADVTKFLKDMGSKTGEPQTKWRFQKKDLPVEDTQVVVLQVE